ncbi:MAG: GPW/gp25 family protein [Alphaproteobacteria bacterium]|nr:GPW/gp25 family protein [Alphaproteobacteria bacterium]
MKDRRTLLERLHRPTPPSGSERSQLIQSIADNLSKLFRTHQGSVKAEHPDDRLRYGMPDLSVILYPKLIGRAEAGVGPQPEVLEDLPAQLRALVRAYEPRLRPESVDVSVQDVPTRPGLLRVGIVATMVLEDVDVGAFHMSAELAPSGRLEVEGR